MQELTFMNVVEGKPKACVYIGCSKNEPFSHVANTGAVASGHAAKAPGTVKASARPIDISALKTVASLLHFASTSRERNSWNVRDMSRSAARASICVP